MRIPREVRLALYNYAKGNGFPYETLGVVIRKDGRAEIIGRPIVDEFLEAEKVFRRVGLYSGNTIAFHDLFPGLADPRILYTLYQEA